MGMTALSALYHTHSPQINPFIIFNRINDSIMKIKQTVQVLFTATCTLFLSSCIFQQVVNNFVRDEYPGVRPPHVIEDNNGKPASNKWVTANPTDLPPSGHLNGKVEYAEDGLPYSLPCEFSNILVSPYAPNYQLDYSNSKVGSKVWDPYTKKPFYIQRHYTFN